MNKQALYETNKYILDKIIDFGGFYKTENTDISSFSDWNARDVIGHINAWVDFFNKKLRSFKNDASFRGLGENGIEEYNKESYEKNRNKKLDDVINESRMLFGEYKNTLELFSEDELFSKKFPTGFDVELWRYASKDLVTHPINHLLYQYLKRRDYERFLSEAGGMHKYCVEYSDGNESMYYFQDLFESEEKKEAALMEILERYKGNDLIKEIIGVAQ
ncbi:MAG: ClbS/DfsB family four-helix bundle protein [Treponema sp.]|nr:ClbS/DfsB family four-helix bundle protein [Treponema sp.]